MRRPLFLLLLLTTAMPLMAGCGDDELPIIPTPIQPTEEVITGTIGPNSARNHPFSVGNAGAVTVTLDGIEPNDPDNPTVIGMDLGTSIEPNLCQITVSNTSVVVGETIGGTATAAGTLCARVYDVTGLPGPITYELFVTHY